MTSNQKKDEPLQSSQSPNVTIKLESDGTLVCGQRRYRPEDGTIRQEILALMAQTASGQLLRHDYQTKLIDNHFCSRPHGIRLATEPYIRRQNNVDKAISRLRQDLTRNFSGDLPPGTSWMCFSRKIDGWLLYRLPGLGCDGEYHW